jgi:stage II sporulation protein E
MIGEVTMHSDRWSEPNPRRVWERRWTAVAVALGSAILGQAILYHHAAPFIVIFSLLIWERRRRWYAPFMAGGLIGTGLGVGLVPTLVLLSWALVVPLPWSRSGWTFLKWPLLVVGSAAIFGVGQLWTTYVLALVAAVACGALVLYYLLSRELEDLKEAGVDRRTLILALASLGCFIAGLAGYRIYDVDLSLFLGALIMLAAAAVQGPAGGAVAGATLGITLAIRGGTHTDFVGILVAGGFLAGWLESRHWRLASLGLLAGVVVYAVFIQLPKPLAPFWFSMALAAIGFQAVPDSLVLTAHQWVDSINPRDTPDAIRERMGRIAAVMKEMARAFRIEEDVDPSETRLVQSAVDSVCKKCSLYRLCWEDEFYRSYRSLLDLALKAEAVLVTSDDLSGDLARRCIRPDDLAQAVNVAMGREKERASMALRVRESRALAELQLAGLADLVVELSEDLRAEPPRRRKRRFNRSAPLPYQVGVAKRPRRGGTVSGDSELISDLSPTRTVFGISDGMGVGPKAAWESGTAMALMEQLLMAGFSQKLAIRAVNTTLLLRSLEENFATLDLGLLDRVAHTMEVVKVAASPTFVRRHGQVFAIRGRTLPVGIVRDVPIDPVIIPVQADDVVVMVTDGVLDETLGDPEERLKQYLLSLPVSEPGMMAETLLSLMLGDSHDGRDDALIMVILLGRMAEVRQRETHAEGPVHEWTRVTLAP